MSVLGIGWHKRRLLQEYFQFGFKVLILPKNPQLSRGEVELNKMKGSPKSTNTSERDILNKVPKMGLSQLTIMVKPVGNSANAKLKARKQQMNSTVSFRTWLSTH